MAGSDLTIHIDKIKGDPQNLRSKVSVNGVKELASSIKGVGLLNPIIVRPFEDHYRIVAGHRRFAAIGLLVDAKEHDGNIEVILRSEDISDAQVTIEQLVENLQREDIGIFDEAAGYARLVELDETITSIASKVGRSKSHVSKRLSLLSLPKDGQKALAEGEITIDEALTVTSLDDDDLAAFVERGRWTSWEIREAGQKAKAKKQALSMAKKAEALGLAVYPHDAEVPEPEGGGTWQHAGTEWGDEWDGVTIPENVTMAQWHVSHSGTARLSFYEPGSALQPGTEAPSTNAEEKRKEREKEQKRTERLTRQAETAFLQATLKKVKVSDLNEIALAYIISSVGYSDAREICALLDLSINTRMEKPYGADEAKEVKDYFGTVREHITACQEQGDIGELRAVALAKLAVARRDMVLSHFAYEAVNDAS